MTPAEQQTMLDDAVRLLKQTTVGYAGHTAAWRANDQTKWFQGFDRIRRVRESLAPTPPPVPPIPPTPFDRKLEVGGNLDDFLAALQPGETGAVAAATFAVRRDVTKGGLPGKPIRVVSADPVKAALITGRVYTTQTANQILFERLHFDGRNVGNLPSWTIGSEDIEFFRCEMTNRHTTIGVNSIDSIWGRAKRLRLRQCKIHEIGKLPAENRHHGAYMGGHDHLIEDCWIWDCADRGIQLQGSFGSIARYNVVDGCGEGVLFGGLGASGNKVYRNVISNSKIRWLIESYWGDGGGIGLSNEAYENLLWPTNPVNPWYNGNLGIDTPTVGFTARDNIVRAPGYSNRAAGDFRRPVDGYGPRVDLLAVAA